MLERIKSFFSKSNTKNYNEGERRDSNMVREIITKGEDEDRIRREVERRMAAIAEREVAIKPKQAKEVEEEPEEAEEEPQQETRPIRKDEDKVYMQPVCVSTEQMFNLLNEKFDVIINWLGQVVSKQNEILSKVKV